MSAERSGPRRRGGRQANNSRLRQGTVEGCSRTTRARGTRHDCEGVKVRRCRFPESSGELRGFKSARKNATTLATFLTTPTSSTSPTVRRSRMVSEDTKDMLKNVDWKTVGGSVTTDPSQPVVKKRLPKKIRQVPECYFLPRRSLPSALAIYGAVCAAGVGAGMLLEVWINKKIKVPLSGKWANDLIAASEEFSFLVFSC
uniref:Uncharacterized protein n=1 Tax=Oryza punctata TaxID=4537 RepID=A0A0E0JGJ9_ORYPU